MWVHEREKCDWPCVARENMLTGATKLSSPNYYFSSICYSYPYHFSHDAFFYSTVLATIVLRPQGTQLAKCSSVVPQRDCSWWHPLLHLPVRRLRSFCSLSDFEFSWIWTGNQYSIPVQQLDQNFRKNIQTFIWNVRRRIWLNLGAGKEAQIHKAN